MLAVPRTCESQSLCQKRDLAKDAVPWNQYPGSEWTASSRGVRVQIPAPLSARVGTPIDINRPHRVRHYPTGPKIHLPHRPHNRRNRKQRHDQPHNAHCHRNNPQSPLLPSPLLPRRFEIRNTKLCAPPVTPPTRIPGHGDRPNGDNQSGKSGNGLSWRQGRDSDLF